MDFIRNNVTHLKYIYVFFIWKDDECTSETEKEGTCLTSEDCTDRDGTASGTCANGYGVCCVGM